MLAGATRSGFGHLRDPEFISEFAVLQRFLSKEIYCDAVAVRESAHTKSWD